MSTPTMSCQWRRLATSLCVWVVYLLCSHKTRADTASNRFHESNLLHHLFHNQNYNPLMRPVRKSNETFHVNLNLQISQIINIDEKNQVMKANVWLQLYWHDYQLKWQPKHYGGITKLSIPAAKIWTPDVVLFNNADGNYEVTYKCNCVLHSSGDIMWIPPAIYKSSCEVNVKYFPFDEQECIMSFGSWTFRREQLKFGFYDNRTTAVFDDYLISGTWDILNCSGWVHDFVDIGENKTMLVYKFYIRRKTLFYTITLIIPCVLISFVTLSVFALPADACEKITLCISILVALVVFMLLVSKILPPSVTIPLISKYLLFTFIMNVFAILITVIVINRNYRTPRTHRMPAWVRLVFLNYLPRFLLMKRPDHDDRCKMEDKSNAQLVKADTHSNSTNGRHMDLVELREIPHPNCRLRRNQNQSELPNGSGPANFAYNKFHISPELRKAIESVKFITHHLKQEDEYEKVREDWKYMALVLDRLVFSVFVIVTVAGTCTIFMEAPHIFDYVDQDKIIRTLKGQIPSGNR